MVQNCIVRGCGSSWCPGSDIKFHAFPNNSTRRKLWLSVVPLKAKFYNSARICSLHFQESDYDSTTRRLKQTAIPTIITNQETLAPGKTISSLHDESMVQIADVTVPSTSSGICESNSPLVETGYDESMMQIAAVAVLPSTSSGICESNSPLVETGYDESMMQIAAVAVLPSTSSGICESNSPLVETGYDESMMQIAAVAVLPSTSSGICESNSPLVETGYDESMMQIAAVAVLLSTSSGICESNSPLVETGHDESMMQISAVAVLPSTSSGICERNSPLMETGVKRAGCNIENQTRKKQSRKILQNISNLNKSPVSSEDHVPVKSDKGIQVKIKSAQEKMLQKKTKILKQKVARQTKKIVNMSSLMSALKEYFRHSEIENIIQGRFADIFKEFNKPQSKHGIQYSEEVKAFALTLNFYSPKAYEFLRKYMTLPHVETIRRSLSLFNCNVGFLSEVLEYLKEQVKLSEKMYLKNVALIFDAMALNISFLTFFRR